MVKKKYIVIIVLLFFILSISIGYAYLNSNLSINGYSSIFSSRWNVYWDNVEVMSESVEAEIPSIVNQTTVNFNILLSNPGDFYEFTVDAKNDGTVDAMIENITKTINNTTTIPNYLKYEVTYADGADILPNHILEANSFEKVKVRVEYNRDIDPEDLPTSPEILNISFEINYIQENENSIPVRETIYNISNSETMIGSTLPNITTYNNYQDAINNFGRPFFLKHIVSNNKIISSYVGFVINDSVHYIKGGIYESGVDDGGSTPVFLENMNIMKDAFGEENCFEWTNNYYRNYTCNGGDVSVYAATDGYIDTGISSSCECYVHVGGGAACTC